MSARLANWAVAELIESAALSGATETAVAAFEWIAETPIAPVANAAPASAPSPDMS